MTAAERIKKQRDWYSKLDNARNTNDVECAYSLMMPVIINKVDYLRGQQIPIDEIDKTILHDISSPFFTFDMATKLYNGFKDYAKWLSDSVDSDTILEEAETFVI